MKKRILFMLTLGLISVPIISGCGNSVSKQESKTYEQSTNKVLSSEEILKYDEYLQVPRLREVSTEIKKDDSIDSYFEKVTKKTDESIDLYSKYSRGSDVFEMTLKDGFCFVDTLENKFKFKLQDDTLKRITNSSIVFFTADQLANCSEVSLKNETANAITLEVNDFDYVNKFLESFSTLNNGSELKTDSPAILVIDKKNKYLKSISISKLKSESSSNQNYKSFEFKQLKLDSDASIEIPNDADSYGEMPEDLIKIFESQMIS